MEGEGGELSLERDSVVSLCGDVQRASACTPGVSAEEEKIFCFHTLRYTPNRKP